MTKKFEACLEFDLACFVKEKEIKMGKKYNRFEIINNSINLPVKHMS